MGGFGKLKAMVNARNYVYSHNSVMFFFSGKRGWNKCRVILDASDTYTMEFWYVNARKGKCNLKDSESGLYWDMLIPHFEEKTGLYLSLF
jgi:hypothetical protein